VKTTHFFLELASSGTLIVKNNGKLNNKYTNQSLGASQPKGLKSIAKISKGYL